MLKLEDVHTSYGHIEALKGISFEVERGEIAALIGANGAGKSTSLMTISGILKPARGRISFEGRPIEGMAPHDIVALGISQVPEGRRVFPILTVRENLEMGAFLRRDGRAARKTLEWVFGLFPVLEGRQQQVAGTLSGGEQQMLAIGRALMAAPRLLLLDEPSLGLAPLLVETIFKVIQEINAAGTTMLLVEQNARMALTLARNGYVMETGRIVLADKAENLLNNEMVRKAYLGE